MKPLPNRNGFALVPLVIAIAVVLGLAGYIVVQRKHKRAEVPAPASDSAVEYRNEQYGLSVKLPAGWRGFSVVNDGYQITEVMRDTRNLGTGLTLRIRHPLWKADAHREDLPVMIIPAALWQRILHEEVAVSAAPVPPTELAHNSRYVFALPPRYNYDYADGWQEVQAIVDAGAVTAFEPVAGWKIYRNERYGFEMEIPSDFGEAIDEDQNASSLRLRGIVFPTGEDINFSVLFFENLAQVPTYQMSDKTAKNLAELLGDPKYDDRVERIMVSGTTGFKITVEKNGFLSVTTLIEYDGHIYQITYNNVAEKINLYNHILSTFRFIK